MFGYDYDFGYIIYYKGISRHGPYRTFNVNSYIEDLKLEHHEFYEIIVEFNGEEVHDITNYNWTNCVKFSCEEDCKNCVEYFNGLLIMNEIMG